MNEATEQDATTDQAGQKERVVSAGNTQLTSAVEIAEELNKGGEWLGTARRWMQDNVKNGDCINWSSPVVVQVPFCKLEHFARCVAISAVAEDRKKRAR